jgi:hypothetical protein
LYITTDWKALTVYIREGSKRPHAAFYRNVRAFPLDWMVFSAAGTASDGLPEGAKSLPAAGGA